MNREEVAAYLRDTRDVEGWFFPIDAALFGVIDDIQKEERVHGDLFEIGVHHGKTAIFLGRAAQEEQSVGVCDVFDQQEWNRDHSGSGNREIFLDNMRRLGRVSADRLRVFAVPSASLTAENTGSRCRFFHVDGGHRPDDVVGDLRTAAAALTKDGVVALDDLFNPNWPGVSEGFYRFLSEQPSTFVPIAIGGNKVFFTRPAAVKLYEKHWPSAAAWHALISTRAYDFAPKEWLGRNVWTAVRLSWVEIDPPGAARLHGD